ncbi:hypothetical protein D0Z00_003767 [Geotrichum galactomycetum]|uniref:Uncharacterized protein n=1 Tax=Geotrichum galactomycetum TaxID=27317 RepID=A0ACB6V0C0_9ASCO|nr:hypothetical protein D0Z00_003767 [Geotrichum candidum]
MHWSWLIIAVVTLYYYYYRYSGVAKLRQKGKEPRQTPEGATPPAQQQHERVIGPEDFEVPEIDPEIERINHRHAGAGAGPSSSTTTVVGTKKARSLERKDQRRAYFEHLRMQAQYEREDHEAYDRQYADLRVEEQAAQAAANRAAVALREARLLEARQQEREAAEHARRLETVLLADAAAHPRGVRRLATEPERAAAARLAERSSSSSTQQFLVGEQADWLVRFSPGDLDRLAQEVRTRGKVSFAELAQYLTDLKRE